jgi:isoleucyl-tRNA synthetase
MDLARDVCSSTLSVRKAHQRRVRLPLNSVTVASPDALRLADFVDLISDEVNVRNVELTTDVASVASEVLRLVPAKLGPRLGKDVQTVIKAHKTGDWSVDGDGDERVVTVGGVVLEAAEFSIEQVASDDQASTGLGSHPGVVALDTTVTAELEREGVARDLVRAIQQARRDADLHVSDRIDVVVTASTEVAEAADVHRGLITGETLADSLEVVVDASDAEPHDPVVAVTLVRSVPAEST